MKQILYLLIGLFSFIILFSCEKETILTIDQTTLSFTDNGGPQTISLTANKPWTASANQSWCKLSPSAGEEAASSRITISCDSNTTYDTRSCNVIFTCAELTKTVSVSQATNNGLIVSQTAYELTKAEQQLNIQVQANVKYSVTVDSGCQDWIKYNSTKGLTTNTVVLDIAENKTYDCREGKVTIKQEDGSLSSTVSIKQSQLDGLFITTPEYNLSNEKHTLTVEVQSNIEFVVKPEVDWIKHVETKGLKTNQIILDVAANEDYDARVGKVEVMQKNGDLSGIITVKQDEKCGIMVSPPEFNLSNESTTIDVELKYNVDFEVVIPNNCSDWVKLVSTKSLSSKTYTFSISKNETYDNREGSITFKQKDGPICTSVLLYQSQTDCIIPEKSEVSISAEEQQVEIKVEANTAYDVIIQGDSSDWIQFINTKGMESSTILLLISINEGQKRIGRILIKGQQVEAKVSIIQEAERNVVFDDIAFKSYCIKYFDRNSDNEISITEAKYISNINCPGLGIQSLNGIEEFENLEQLYCPGNKIYNIDVRKNNKLRNLFCGQNLIVEIDLSNNPNLEQLSCGWNRMKALDVRSNVALKTLNCGMNLLTELDLRNNKALESLYCDGNQLKMLDISQNVVLSILDCSSNQLSHIDVFNNKALTSIHCDSNQLQEIDVSSCVNLSELHCSSNQLKTINISGARGLKHLMCNENTLSYLNLENNDALVSLYCGGNQLTSLDLSHNTALTIVDCPNNLLNNLELSHNSNLRSVHCHNNQLTKLNVSESTALTDLWCSSNLLSSLDVSKNPVLSSLAILR